jgi:hypothetical protein
LLSVRNIGGEKGEKKGREWSAYRVHEPGLAPGEPHACFLCGWCRYKKDPLFLYKNVSVCEGCYLVFAELALQCSSQSHPSLYMVLHNPQLAAMFHQHRRGSSTSHARYV